MDIIITGMNGTVAPVLARALEKQGHKIHPWNRSEIDPDDLSACARHIRESAPGALFHLAMGAPEWAAAMARTCSELQIPFIFTSTVSVFSSNQPAPIPPDAEPDAADDYGRYKAECERLVRAASPAAVIARLGWQIGRSPGSNNMVDFLVKQQDDHGHINASTRWHPSTAFLEDTADALAGLLQAEPGIYNLEGNPGLHFFDIVTNLNTLLDMNWNVQPADEPYMDNRMTDPKVTVQPITRHFS